MNIDNYSLIYQKELELQETDPVLLYKQVHNRNNIMYILEKSKFTSYNLYGNYHLFQCKQISIIDKLHVNMLNIFPYVDLNNTNGPSYLKEIILDIIDTKPDILIKISKLSDKFYLQYYFKKSERMFENANYKLISKEYQKLLNEQVFVNEIDKIYNEDIIPLSMLPSTFKVNSNVNKITLYKYQEDDIIWMKKIENNSYKIEMNNMPIKYKGGNIISEMGLGKSIIVLSFIIESINEYDDYIESYSKECNYFFKRGKNMYNACVKRVKDNNLYCTEHGKRNFYDKLKLILNEEKITKDVNLFLNEDKLISNASVIICPDHLGDQWCMEYYNKIKSVKTKRVLVILTSYQYDNLLISDVLFADIIIISYNLLLYYKIINDRKITCNLGEYLKLNKRLIEGNIPLNSFTFKRIFLDEVHQLNDILKIKVQSLSSKFVWNISGTPFINGFEGYLKMLSYNTDLESHLKHIDQEAVAVLLNNCFMLFRRNTKNNILKSTNEELLSKVTSNLKLLDFTDEERELYNGFIIGNISPYSEQMVKFCCDPELYNKTRNIISSCKSLSEVRDVIYKALNKDILMLEKEIISLKERIEMSTDPLILRGLRTSLTVNTKTRDNKEKTIIYMKEHIVETTVSEMCCICLDDITKIAVTQCGHKYCHQCINNFIESNRMSNCFKCPQCCTILNKNQIYYIKDIILDELGDIVQTVKSTKIGNIIYYIKHNLKPDDKIIIFSQWDELLHKVGNRISEYFNVLYCNGSLYTKNKAIKQFNSDELNNQIILLSSQNAASGINLSVANKIIFIEPISGDYKYRQETENQALGRARRLDNKKSIEVIKFIIKETIEQDIYNNNIDENRIRLYN
jgi:hypothetical protein